jgi:plastocyanin
MTSLKRSLVAAVSAAPLLLLTACGGGSSGSSSAPPSDADLVVVGKEYKFDKSEYTVKAGAVKISYTDRGTLTHSLLIEGLPGSKINLGPGQTKTKTVTLPAGTYKLYCDLSGHEALGMKSVLVVQP